MPSAVPGHRAVSTGPELDNTSREWIEGLRASGARHEETVARLRAALLRVGRREVDRRRATLDFRGPELEDIAEQAATDAMISILTKLGGFRGESRLTT